MPNTEIKILFALIHLDSKVQDAIGELSACLFQSYFPPYIIPQYPRKFLIVKSIWLENIRVMFMIIVPERIWKNGKKEWFFYDYAYNQYKVH